MTPDEAIGGHHPDLRLPGDTGIPARYVNVPRFTRWTFDLESIRRWAEWHLDGRVLNACAGKNHLHHDDEIVRNDINFDRDADLHVDAAELSAHFPAESFDTIVFDPIGEGKAVIGSVDRKTQNELGRYLQR